LQVVVLPKRCNILPKFILEQGDVIGVHTNTIPKEDCNVVGANAIKQFHFSPGILKGKPVKTVIAIPVNFKRQK